MRTKEVVTLECTNNISPFHSLLLDAAKGHYVDVMNGDDKDAINKLEDSLKESLNAFATNAFNMGRDYEKNKSL